MEKRMRRQLPLLAISGLLAVVLISAGIHYWWVWAMWVVVVACQIGVGLGLQERLEPKPPTPLRHERPEYKQRLELFELDREHQAKVDEWRARQQDQQ